MKEFAPLRDAGPLEAILSEVSFLGGLSAEQRKRLYGYFETTECDPGEVIARRGGEPTHIHIIARGRVDLRIESGDVTVAKRSFGVGDAFGEAAMLSLVNNTASFVAAESCELIVFSRKALNRLHTEAPDLFCRLILNLARELARKLQYTDEMLLRERGGGAGGAAAD